MTQIGKFENMNKKKKLMLPEWKHVILSVNYGCVLGPIWHFEQ